MEGDGGDGDELSGGDSGSLHGGLAASCGRIQRISRSEMNKIWIKLFAAQATSAGGGSAKAIVASSAVEVTAATASVTEWRQEGTNTDRE